MSEERKAYRMLVDSKVDPTLKKGDTVYRLVKYDYGSASDDTRGLGYPCRSMTRDPEGDYPFIVVPEKDMEEII